VNHAQHSQHASRFFDRLVGVVTLDVPTYRSIQQDRRGTVQAAGVVAIAAIATAIGGISQFSWLTLALLAAIVGWAVASGRAFGLFSSVARKSMNRSRFDAFRSNLERRHEIALGVAAIAFLVLLVLGTSADGIGWSTVALTVPFISWFAFSGVAWYQARQQAAATMTPPPRFVTLLRTVGFAHAPGVFAFFGFIPLIGILVALIVPIWAVLTMVFAIRHTLAFTMDQALATAILATSVTSLGTALMVIVA
jgi:hypothetical protein